MSLHPSSLTIFKDLKPEDKLSFEQEEIIRDNVINNMHRLAAYAILGYADWVIKYILKN